jgi:hypothetical protein
MTQAIADGPAILEIEEDAAQEAHLNPDFGAGLTIPSRNSTAVDLRAVPLRLLAEREAPTLPSSAGWGGTSKMAWFHRPFAFAVGVNALQNADDVLDWLAGNDRWRRHDGGFYTADVMSVEKLDPPALCAPLFNAEGRSGLERAASLLFGEQLQLHGPVVAHRMTPPQGIGIHSDAPQPDEETHRLVVLLADGWSRPQGGHFVLLERDSPMSARMIIPHRHNTAIAFRLTGQSFHAVTTLTSGRRFSIVASFRPA